MSKDLEGQVAFITGAAHGQGRAVALKLAREGAHIAALDVAKPLHYPAYAMGTSNELTTLQREVEALGVQARVYAADVRDDAGVAVAVADAAQAWSLARALSCGRRG